MKVERSREERFAEAAGKIGYVGTVGSLAIISAVTVCAIIIRFFYVNNLALWAVSHYGPGAAAAFGGVSSFATYYGWSRIVRRKMRLNAKEEGKSEAQSQLAGFIQSLPDTLAGCFSQASTTAALGVSIAVSTVAYFPPASEAFNNAVNSAERAVVRAIRPDSEKPEDAAAEEQAAEAEEAGEAAETAEAEETAESAEAAEEAAGAAEKAEAAAKEAEFAESRRIYRQAGEEKPREIKPAKPAEAKPAESKPAERRAQSPPEEAPAPSEPPVPGHAAASPGQASQEEDGPAAAPAQDGGEAEGMAGGATDSAETGKAKAAGRSILSLGFRAGFNFSQFHAKYSGGSGSHKSIPGFQGGIALDIAPFRWLRIQPGIMYIQKGAEDLNGASLPLHYIELPALLWLKYSSLRLGAGPYAGLCLSAPPGLSDALDMGIQYGLGFDIGMFYVGAFYGWGFSNVGAAGGWEYYNRALGFNLGVNL